MEKRSVWLDRKDFYFDPIAAYNAVRFFESEIYHVKGPKAGTRLKLERWQRRFVRRVYGWKRRDDNTRRYRVAFMFIPRKNGKALALDTPVITPGGWRTMGDLQPGDFVFAPDGTPTTVTGVTAVQYDRPCYRMRFSDGAEVIADAAHEWVTKSRSSENPRVRETQEIAKTLRCGHRKDRVEHNHSLSIASALKYPIADLPIPPYTLGVWLGDGNTNTAQITMSDSDVEILDVIRAEGITTGDPQYKNGTKNIKVAIGSLEYRQCRRGHAENEYIISKEGKHKCRACERENGHRKRNGKAMTPRARFTLQEKLRDLGVLGRKHIPEVYLRSGYEQRLALLRGLMDTDGYCAVDGQCEFCTTLPSLRDNMLDLVRGLGLKPRVFTGRARCQGKDCGESYRVSFTPDVSLPVFNLRRKFAKQRIVSKTARSRTVYITSVEPCPSVPVKCIEVAHESHCYLAGPTSLPTHNSLLGAAMALYGLFADNEIGAEVVSAAVDRDQARAIFDVAAQIVRLNPRLSALCKVYTKSIVVYHTASKYTVLSADVENKHGLNPSTIIFDELHTQPNGKLVEVLKTGTQARAQPLQVYFTTAGHDRNTVCYDYYLRAKRALSGEVYDPTFLGIIYEVDKETQKNPEAWKDPAVWRKANPNFGVSVIPNNFLEAFKEACQNKREENSFKRLYLNIWTDTEEVWLEQDDWDGCGVEKFSPEDLQGQLCVAGLDLSRKSDFTALTLTFLTKDGTTRVLPFFWLPKDGPWRKEENVRDQYKAWIDEGCIDVCEGQVIDFDYVINKIDSLGEIYRIKEIAYDPTFATELATKLDHKGFKMVEIRQGFGRMSEPSKLLESFLLARTLRHNDHPVLTWMSRHAACDTDAQGNIRPSKGKSRDRIDGVVSLVLSLARFIVLKPKKKSRYETEGLDST